MSVNEESSQKSGEGYSNNFAAAFTAVTQGLFYGMVQNITSGIILESPWNTYSAAIIGFISAAALIGGFIGSFFSGFVADRIGPKKTLGLAALICLVCNIVLCAQKNIGVMIAFRLIGGISIGCVSAVAPMYQGEQASMKYRGVICTIFQLAVTIGILIAFGVNFAFSYAPAGSNVWRWEFLSTIVFPVIYLIGWFFIPESRGYLEKKKKETLAKERGETVVNPSILHDIKEIWIAATSSKHAFVVGVVLGALVQASGINAIMSYSPYIIESVGITDQRMMLLGTIFVGIWNMVSTLIALPLVGRFGRKPLLLIAYAGAFLGNLLSSIATFVPGLANHRYALSIPGLVIFLLAFEIGPGPLFGLVACELYPDAVRGRAMGIALCVNWTACIIVVQFYPILSKAIGVQWVFLILALFCVLAFIFIVFVVPETKHVNLQNVGRSEEEAEQGNGGIKRDVSETRVEPKVGPVVELEDEVA